MKLSVPGNAPAVVSFTHSGRSNFAVVGYASSGERTGLLVNTIGRYQGTRPLNFAGTKTAQFEVKADGAWTASIQPLSGIPPAAKAAQGAGDNLISVASLKPQTAQATHDGKSNFAVIAYSASGERLGLMINEIGQYQGRVRVPSGAGFLEVVADGNWTFAFE